MSAVVTRAAVAGRRLAWFVGQEAMCCLFAAGVFAALAFSRVAHIPGVPRYDFLLALCLGLQWLMVRLRLETRDELMAILAFHAIGLGMEIYKVRMGSWAYPEAAYLKVAGVPLYSGFMYASVGSYVCQAWRRFDLRLEPWPRSWAAILLAAAIYANFFTLHQLPDLRPVLVLAAVVIFWRTQADFRLNDARGRMPLALSFLLIGFCVWLAENVATRLGAWRYPYQQEGWTMVHGSKIGSWGLLIIVTVVVVAELKRFKTRGSEGQSLPIDQ